MTASWFGPWFGNGRWFGPWFPDGQVDPANFAGYGPPGAATFVLNLEAGLSVKHTWTTDIIKRRDGTEQRISINDAPIQTYSGRAILTGDNPRRVRSQLATYASLGSVFLLGLPFEELTVGGSVGAVVSVDPTAQAYTDWTKVGQRVVLMSPDAETTASAVIQSVASGYITLDVDPGAAGVAWSRIMPAMAILLDPQQGFPRYAKDVEEWNISARAKIFDFAATKASLDLDPVTVSAAFDNVTIVSRIDGLPGNAVYFGLSNTGSGTGTLVEADGEVQFNYEAGVTTLADLKAALDLSSYVQMVGSWTGTDTIAAADDTGFVLQLSGAEALGSAGAGAILTTYDGRPVWDRPIQLDVTSNDSLQSMTEVIDFGGIPYAIGQADFSDWGRAIKLERDSAAEWQWFKLFTWTVRGRQVAFWLPSYRDDFTFISKSTNTINVSTEDGSNIFAWWPYQRDRLEIKQADGTVTRVQIAGAADNGDGSATLTIGVTLSSSPVERVSWLELCRFESDTFDITWQGSAFTVQAVARAIRQ